MQSHVKNLHRTTVHGLLFVAALLACITPQLFLAHKAEASTYTNSHFIDNSILLNANVMNADNIQTFLASKSGVLKSSSFLMDCDIAGATAKQMYLSISAPCGQTVAVSQLIFYSSQIYGINPEAVMATLQKEQGLITDPAPTSTAIAQAMGYGCPDSGGCSSNSSFFYQIDNGTWALRFHYERANGNNNWWYASTSWACGSASNYYKPSLYPKQNVNFYDDNGTMYATVYIENAATSSLYCYTPHAYNNPQALYGRPAFGTTGQYYSGSYNFVYYFELWFGSTYAYLYNGLDYSIVFDADYYLNANPDLKDAFGNNQAEAFSHFINYGMKEGRQGNANFNVTSYRNRYQDLRMMFGTNLPAYYQHYITNGEREGRTATGNAAISYITSYNGIDYSSVYDYATYMTNYPDLAKAFSNDDAGAIKHFVNYGMNEGRIANQNFNITSYQDRYYDLRHDFGANLKPYYLHYINYGKNEGRIATGSYLGGTSVQNTVNYSAVYDFGTYEANYSDIKNTFGLNDINALQHFISYGMNEGRQGSGNFNVYAYKARYPDLQAAYGNNLKMYYMHFMNYGQAEGRIGN